MEFENMLRYCRELELNNNRAWFHENHKQYEVAKEDFTELVDMVKYAVVERVDSSLQEKLIFADPKSMMYRIPRDARMYKTKPPYNPTWRAYISPDKKQLLPLGYFMMVAPDGRSHLGTGAWCPDKDYLHRVRDFIAERWEELDQLIEESGLSLVGEKLKRCPGEYDADHPAAEYLKHKSWIFIESVPVEEFESFEEYIAYIGALLDRMEPLRRFFERAMQDKVESIWDRLEWK